MKKLLTFAMTLLLMGCSHHTYVVSSGDDSKSTTKVAIGYPNSPKTDDVVTRKKLPEMVGDKNAAAFMPNATAFRMSGDYANNVAITIDNNGVITYFPAPSDITADSEPIELCNGWWLNNQGLGPNSVFTKYTFAEYSSLPEAPDLIQLKEAVIPGAMVTGFMELPMKIGDANANIEEAKNYVKGN